MPRGVYDRSAKNQGEPKAAKPSKTKTAAVAATKKVQAAPATKTRANVVAHPTAAVAEQFAILTANIQTLANVRKDLTGNEAVAKRTEQEIIQHVAAIRDLRQKIFGLTAEEQQEAADKEEPETKSVPQLVAPANNGGVSLPPAAAKPLIPVPPSPSASS